MNQIEAKRMVFATLCITYCISVPSI